MGNFSFSFKYLTSFYLSTNISEAWVRREIALSFPISHYWQICERYRQLRVDHGDRTLMHSARGVNLYFPENGLSFYGFLDQRVYTIPFVHERPTRWGGKHMMGCLGNLIGLANQALAVLYSHPLV